jgi:hypothetical protein
MAKTNFDDLNLDTTGKQIARPADSVGVNTAEQPDRSGFHYNLCFGSIARGALNEPKTGRAGHFAESYYLQKK